VVKIECYLPFHNQVKECEIKNPHRKGNSGCSSKIIEGEAEL